MISKIVLITLISVPYFSFCASSDSDDSSVDVALRAFAQAEKELGEMCSRGVDVDGIISGLSGPRRTLKPETIIRLLKQGSYTNPYGSQESIIEFRRREALRLMAHAPCPPRAADDKYHENDSVFLHGLKASTELNGMPAIVLGEGSLDDRGELRYPVRLMTRNCFRVEFKDVQVRVENLRVALGFPRNKHFEHAGYHYDDLTEQERAELEGVAWLFQQAIMNPEEQKLESVVLFGFWLHHYSYFTLPLLFEHLRNIRGVHYAAKMKEFCPYVFVSESECSAVRELNGELRGRIPLLGRLSLYS